MLATPGTGLADPQGVDGTGCQATSRRRMPIIGSYRNAAVDTASQGPPPIISHGAAIRVSLIPACLSQPC